MSSNRLWILILWILVGTTFKLCAQNPEKIDSIKKVLNTAGLDPNQRLEALYLLSSVPSSPSEKLLFASRLLNLAKELNNFEYKIKANFRIGIAYRYKGELVKAQETLFKCANEIVGKEQFNSLLADIYSEISTCYTQSGDSENALLYSSKAINMLRGTNRRQVLAINLLNTGYDYYLTHNYDSAEAYYNESESIFLDIGMTLGLAYIVGNRALVYWKRGDTESAKRDLTKTIQMLKPLDDRFGISDYYNQLGNIYLEENQLDKATTYLMKGLELAKSEGLKEQVRDASRLLFLTYEGKGNYEEAVAYQTQYYAYKDSIRNLESTQKLANLRTAFEVGQKQAEVDLLLEQKRSNQIIIITGGIILVIFICLLVLIYLYSKSKSKLNKQLQEQKNSLLVLNQTKDRFFSIISHDLRGPVNALNGLVTVTRHMINDDKNEDRLPEMVGRMEDAIGRLVKLLDNLLNWALQQRGHFPFAPEKLSLALLLEEVIEMFGDMATYKNISIDHQIGDSINLYTDKNATSTILRNLINNAIKFTPEGGNISISAKKDPNGQFALVQIKDNGVGIDEKKLKNLFKLNEKISTKGTSGESGLGLGLQLVVEFVEINKGKIDVESQLGKGTTFNILLPLVKEI